MRILFCITLLAFCGLTGSLSAQTVETVQAAPAVNHFQGDIDAIRRYDQIYTPPANPILFIGSSSIVKWHDLERTFSNYVVMNRGFGGSVTNDIIYFAKDIIFPYHPRQIVIYVGDNDLPQEGATADTILNRFKNLYALIRSQLPQVPIAYISIKPSPSRAVFLPKAMAANKLIREFLEKEANTKFIDIYTPMLDDQNNPRKELFLGDMLHMNSQGYDIWRKAVEPVLVPLNQQ
ncbi:GDSL-type esterase/lipase family protein [Chitinophaga sp. MM2321]|uniref:GDSL-type esterase/lipase family protein n=1 Tax=Chitinophaga sp. MM2321 TaxID=3137178 RepID=UPI0032D59E6E